MNPIVYNLHQKAVQNFDQIPPDQQPKVMQLVSEIQQAARANNQKKLMELGLQLQQELSSL
jgi:diadenosine tetraphosphate (Ap4A) HIT family hydrolase